MCGIYGFINKTDKSINLATLKKVAIDTEKRGPHAFGLAWLDRRGRLHSFKSPGKISENLNVLKRVRNARILIAHTRWATHGDPADNVNNHPHVSGKGMLVHNGVVPEYLELMVKNNLDPISDCDSEVLALLIAQTTKSSLLKRVKRTIDQTTGKLSIAGIWGKTLVLARRSMQPLHYKINEGSVWFSSLGKHLPGSAGLYQVMDNYACSFTLVCNGKKVKIDDIDLKKKSRASMGFKNFPQPTGDRWVPQTSKKTSTRIWPEPEKSGPIVTLPGRVPTGAIVTGKGNGWVEYDMPSKQWFELMNTA